VALAPRESVSQVQLSSWTFNNNFLFSNVGVGQLNQDSTALANLNIGIGQLNV